MTTEADEFSSLTARGVTSRVMVEGSGGTETLEGHVTLADWDDYDWRDNEQVRDFANALPGVSILTVSSEGSEHLWNLSIRDPDRVALDLLTLKSDPMRTQMGWTWTPTRWVTRVGPKRYQEGHEREGEVYRKAPKLAGIRVVPTTVPQSEGHWNIARAMVRDFPEHGTGHEMLADLEWTKCGPEVVQYLTMTDEEREVWHADE